MAERVISAYTLRNLLMCERRIWLDHKGNPDLRSEVPQNQAARGIAHEQNVTAAMFGQVTSVAVNSWSEMLETTRDLMGQGVTGIQGATFERVIQLSQPLIVRGRVDWLRRFAQPSDFGAWAYEPVEIKLHRELTNADRLQLDLYIWLLGTIQNVEPSGWFWLGHDVHHKPLNVIEHFYDEQRLLNALERVDSLLYQTSAPPIYLASHCQSCHWYRLCRQSAAENRSLASLSGLSRQTWEHMRQEGITTVDQILFLTPKDLERFKGLGKAKAAELHSYAQAVHWSRAVQRTPLPEPARHTGIMLDLETCMDMETMGIPWCFGWQEYGGQFQVAVVDRFYESAAPKLPDGTTVTMISDSDEGWRLIADAAQRNPGPVYHWGNFEKGVLRSTAPQDAIDILDNRLHDMNRTFKKSFVFPVRGTSIKTIAPYLGFTWPSETSAFTAWADYQAWLIESDADALARACAYNRADVEAMSLIWQWMMDNDGILNLPE
ncbi:MAG: TM0106 family RecB-like putative nuclease [Chloroflexota bacterium]